MLGVVTHCNLQKRWLDTRCLLVASYIGTEFGSPFATISVIILNILCLNAVRRAEAKGSDQTFLLHCIYSQGRQIDMVSGMTVVGLRTCGWKRHRWLDGVHLRISVQSRTKAFPASTSSSTSEAGKGKSQ